MKAEAAIQQIAPPEPDLAPEEMIQRARQLVPYLREQAPISDRNRRISDDVSQRLIESGFYRILQPRVFGGYEFDLRTYTETILELSRGDGAIGWVVGFNTGHVLHAARLPLKGQIEVFGQGGDFRSPIVATPFGDAKETNDGYIINGAWNYASGCDISNWLGVYVKVPGPDESAPPDMRICFIRNTEYEIVDNWHVIGMRGTGSKQAVVKDLFVPKERTFSYSQVLSHNTAPGHGVHKNPMYQIPIQPMLATQISMVAVGVAQAAIDVFADYAENKRGSFPPFALLKEERRVHSAMGRAIAKHEAARACLFTLVNRQSQRREWVKTGRTITNEEVLMDIALCQQIAILSAETVDIVTLAAGSSGSREGNPLEKISRDMNMIRTHYYFDHARTAENVGSLRFGIPPQSYL